MHGLGSKRRRRLRQCLWTAQDGRCALCRGQMFDAIDPLSPAYPTLDHKLPRANGGTTSKDNLWLVHRECNDEKGDK